MIYHTDETTIIAQCTPKGSGAIALIRLSGVDAIALVSRIARLASAKELAAVPTHTIHYGTVVADAQLIDTVLFLVMRAPHTFTGQDTVEITSHNNQFLIERIIQAAIASGARLAGNGEFTRRAYLNGKIDLLQAEAINELITANNQLALKQSLAQLEGSFSQWIAAIEKSLLSCLALSEASFEFLDDELEFADQIKSQLEHVLHMIGHIKKTFDQQKHIRQGIRIAIIGSVNAGKSALFNALLQQKRSIVTDIAGTTRDAVEAGLYRDQSYWTLIDTAGLRQTEDIVEQEGIKRSEQEAAHADIILLVFDGSKTVQDKELVIYKNIADQYKQKIILIRNKIDLPQIANDFLDIPAIAVSAHRNSNLNAIESVIKEKIDQLIHSTDAPFLLNQRHFNHLLSLEQKLREVIPLLTAMPAYELISIHLQDALASLTQLTGKTICEQGMDAVFRQFCVGK